MGVFSCDYGVNNQQVAASEKGVPNFLFFGWFCQCNQLIISSLRTQKEAGRKKPRLKNHQKPPFFGGFPPCVFRPNFQIVTVPSETGIRFHTAGGSSEAVICFRIVTRTVFSMSVGKQMNDKQLEENMVCLIDDYEMEYEVKVKEGIERMWPVWKVLIHIAQGQASTTPHLFPINFTSCRFQKKVILQDY